MKTCTKCLLEKLESAFSRNSKSKDGLQYTCRECASAYQSKYHAEDPGRTRAKVAKYRKDNPEKSIECSTRYYLENIERISQYKKDWVSKNRDRIRMYSKSHTPEAKARNAARSAAWRENNKSKARAAPYKMSDAQKEIRKAYGAAWYIKNKELMRSRDRNRRARLKNAEGWHSKTDIIIMLSMQSNACAACGGDLVMSGFGVYHIDHIVPLVLGGSNWPSNLQALCPCCNLSKGAKDPIDWSLENLWLMRRYGNQGLDGKYMLRA